MRPRLRGLTLATGLTAATLLLTSLAGPQSGEDAFFQAYYFHHETGELERALELYETVANRGGDLGTRARAAAEEIREDLRTSDFTHLMPADTIVYVELNRPGDQLRALTEQLGLAGSEDGAPGLGLSPRLMDAALGMRGAALAITHIDPQGGPPEGVLVLHPGDQDALRGLIETGLGNAAEPVDAIAGAPTYRIEGQAYVAITRRLVVASLDRASIEGVVRRLRGQGSDSFADSLAETTGAGLRGDDLLFFHVAAEPVMPMLRGILEQEASRDPELAMAMAFFDVESLVGLSGRVGVDERGLGLELGLELEEGHQNLAFNLLRLPALQAEHIAHVPAGAAFVFAAALNESGPVAAPTGGAERPIVSGLDFGRELFANLVDVTVYGLPPGESSQSGPLPDIVASLHVNDVNRSRALWNFVLGLASQSTGAGTMEPEHLQVAGHPVEQYVMDGVPVFLHVGDRELLVTPSRAALERTFAARAAGRTIARDDLMRSSLQGLGEGTNLALVASPSRCARLAQGFAPRSEQEQLQQVAAVLQDTIVAIGIRQTSTELAVKAQIHNLPNVAPLLAQVLREQRDGGTVFAQQARPATSPRSASASDPRAAFEVAVSNRDREAALAALQPLAEVLMEDANGLNDLAWNLLTEDRYHREFDEAARKLSRRSNALSEYDNWMYLDTLALAEFRCGDVEEAIQLERKAWKRVQGTGREAEVKAQLDTFEAALATTTVGAR